MISEIKTLCLQQFQNIIHKLSARNSVLNNSLTTFKSLVVLN